MTMSGPASHPAIMQTESGPRLDFDGFRNVLKDVTMQEEQNELYSLPKSINGYCIRTQRIKFGVMYGRFYVRKEKTESFIKHLLNDGYYTWIEISPFSAPKSEWEEIEKEGFMVNEKT